MFRNRTHVVCGYSRRAVAFYTQHLGFTLDRDMRPAIAMVSRDGIPFSET